MELPVQATQKTTLISPTVLLVCLLIIVAVWGGFVAVADPIFKNFDAGEFAIVARNLLRGKGFTTDVYWMWVRDYGALNHPEDTWPPMQAILAGIAFALLGVKISAFYWMVVCSLLALLIAVYVIAGRLFDKWTALVAVSALFTSPMLISLASAGANDIGATFFYLCALYALYKSFEEGASYKWVIIGALFTGFGILQKFQGVLIVISYTIWQLCYLRSSPKTVLKKTALFFVVLLIVGAPLMIRNYRVFGQFTYPTSKLLNAIAASWDPLDNRWRMNLVFYKLYWEHEQPSYSYLAKHRRLKYLIYDRQKFEVKRWLVYILQGAIVPRLLFILGALGMALSWKSHRKWCLWSLLTMACSVSYVIFGQMEPRYFLFFNPLLAIFGAHFLLLVGRRASRFSPLLVILFALILASVFVKQGFPYWKSALTVNPARQYFIDRFTIAGDWLRKNLEPDEGVVTQFTAQLCFLIDRGGAIYPNVDLERFIRLADKYKLKYLMLNNLQNHLNLFKRPGTEHWLLRQLAPLFAGQEVYGFKLEYRDGNNFIIYRIPKPNEVDLKALPKLPPEPDDFTILLLEPNRGGLKDPPPPLNLESVNP